MSDPTHDNGAYDNPPDPVVEEVAKYLHASFSDTPYEDWSMWINAHNIVTLVRKLDREANAR
jgi:hypothetical protein